MSGEGDPTLRKLQQVAIAYNCMQSGLPYGKDGTGFENIDYIIIEGDDGEKYFVLSLVDSHEVQEILIPIDGLGRRQSP